MRLPPAPEEPPLEVPLSPSVLALYVPPQLTTAPARARTPKPTEAARRMNGNTTMDKR